MDEDELLEQPERLSRHDSKAASRKAKKTESGLDMRNPGTFYNLPWACPYSRRTIKRSIARWYPSSCRHDRTARLSFRYEEDRQLVAINRLPSGCVAEHIRERVLAP